jgi:hypothetical protein
MNPVVEALALLTPFDIDKPKIRLGPPADGGYVFVEDISPDQAIVSYGISTEYSFDAEMADKGHDVYMFDHTIPGIDATSKRMHFFREGVAGSSDPAASLYTIEDHLARHAIPGDRLILKMDVEGAEFAALSAVPDRVLERFEQIVLEVHGLHRMADFAYRETFCTVFRKLNRLFTLFHVHANNFDGPNGLHIVSGLPVSSLLELSYVRTNTVKPSPSRTLYPTPLDYPNVGHKDKLLWFYPFLPTSIEPDGFSTSETINRMAARKALAPRIKLINVALGKPATQSSTSPWSSPGEAARAVSGTMPTNFAFHTDLEDRPWWQVDLLDTYPIDAIVVHNRLDIRQDRARSLTVEVSEDNQTWLTVYAGLVMFSGGDRGDPLELPLRSLVRGRYVRIALSAKEYLHLAQVEVFIRGELMEFSRFRLRHGLNKLKSKIEAPDASMHHIYTIERSSFSNTDSPIDGLKIHYTGRFGNLIQQYTNMILFAERTGLHYIQLGTHELLGIPGPRRIGSLTFLPKASPLPPGGSFITGTFYDPEFFSPVLKSTWENYEEIEQCRVVRDIIRPHLLSPLATRSSGEDRRELTIHIRSGDVFGESGNIHHLYRQPPLGFYKLVVESLVKAGSIDRVKLVFEDRGNPCVDTLEQFLVAEAIPFRTQSGTLLADLSALVDAPHLVFGFGTFGYSVCRLSTEVETVHYFEPEHGGVYAAIPGIGRVFAVRDRRGEYIKPGEWRNTPEQREMMLSYPVDALTVDEVEPRSS